LQKENKFLARQVCDYHHWHGAQAKT